MAGNYWTEIHGGFSLFAMDELNKQIDAFNQANEADLAKAENGLQFGLILGYDLDSKPGTIGIAVESFVSSNSFSSSLPDSVNDPDFSLEYTVPAFSFRFFFSGYVPWFESEKSRTSLGGSVGFLTTVGDLKYNREAVYEEGEIVEEEISESSGLEKFASFLDFFLNTTYQLSNKFGLSFLAGYRVMPDIDISVDQPTIGGSYGLDYSGLFGHVGFRYLFGK